MYRVSAKKTIVLLIVISRQIIRETHFHLFLELGSHVDIITSFYLYILRYMLNIEINKHLLRK